jgi:acetate kinase
MKILVINSGSSSLKCQVFEKGDDSSLTCLAKGLVERIGIAGSSLRIKANDGRGCDIKADVSDHVGAIFLLKEYLTHPDHGILSDIAEIKGVGHRVVHGAEQFMESVIIDDRVINATEECSRLAPLHNPPNLLGIKACQSMLPGIPQVAVYDTAFHQTMPRKAYLYGLPYNYLKDHGIRRYGFHGTSHRYVSSQVPAILNKPAESLKFVTCHLGNGSSLAAIDGGKSVDTSMGLTPLEGVVMGTRCGDIDPAIILFLQEMDGMPFQEVNTLLNKKSGLLGLCGRSDMRDIEAAAASGDEACRIALDVFVYRIVKKIGAYAAAMDGLDAIVFTAGIGENSPTVRRMVAGHFGFLGLELDGLRNEKNETVISTDASGVALLVVPTNEEFLIALDTLRLISKD